MQTQPKSDQELLQMYFAGNAAAFETLIERHKDKVYTAIFLKVRDTHLAEDIFQETFIKALDTLRAGKYNEEGKFLPWIMRIGFNLCIDHFRKLKRSPDVVTAEGDDQFNYLRQDEHSTETHWERTKGENKLKELIDLLPDDQKEVIMLRHYFDFSFKEIAEYTHVSINTSLGRMRYALMNLRKLMDKHQVTITRLNVA